MVLHLAKYLFQDRADRHSFHALRLLAGKGEKTADDSLDPRYLPADDLRLFPAWVPRFQLHQQNLRISPDNSHGIVDFVSDSGSQFSHGSKLLRPYQL